VGGGNGIDSNVAKDSKEEAKQSAVDSLPRIGGNFVRAKEGDLSKK